MTTQKKVLRLHALSEVFQSSTVIEIICHNHHLFHVGSHKCIGKLKDNEGKVIILY